MAWHFLLYDSTGYPYTTVDKFFTTRAYQFPFSISVFYLSRYLEEEGNATWIAAKRGFSFLLTYTWLSYTLPSGFFLLATASPSSTTTDPFSEDVLVDGGFFVWCEGDST